MIMNKKWYVLHVKVGKEQSIINQLYEMKNIKSVVFPRRALYERKQGSLLYVEKPLFPGYIFVETTVTVKLYEDLKKMSNVFRLMDKEKSSELAVNPVDFREIEWLFSLMSSTGLIGIFDGVRLDNKFIPLNKQLLGEKFKIVKVNWRKKRARVNFKIFEQNKEFDLSINIVNKS